MSFAARAPRVSVSAAADEGGVDVGIGDDGNEDEDEPPGECVSDLKPGPEVSLIA